LRLGGIVVFGQKEEVDEAKNETESGRTGSALNKMEQRSVEYILSQHRIKAADRMPMRRLAICTKCFFWLRVKTGVNDMNKLIQRCCKEEEIRKRLREEDKEERREKMASAIRFDKPPEASTLIICHSFAELQLT
jgi:hypothetical protein